MSLPDDFAAWRAGAGGWASDPAGWDQDTQRPGISLFGNAVQTWAVMQDRSKVTVAEAALAFNVAPRRIIEAVEQHYWMFIDGPVDYGTDFSKLTIEHEGE